MISIALIPKSGELMVHHALDREPRSLLIGKKRGWVWAEDGLYPLTAILPVSLRKAYANGGAVVGREEVLSFLTEGMEPLEDQFLVDCDVSLDQFTVHDGIPEFRIELTGTPERLETKVWASYRGHRVRAAVRSRGDPEWFPIAGRPLEYDRRNPDAEQDAVERLAAAGPFEWDERDARFRDIRGVEPVMRVLSDVVPDLRRQDWGVEFGGILETLIAKAQWVHPVVHLRPSEAAGWFEAAVRYCDPQGRQVDAGTVESSLAHGQGILKEDDRLLLLNTSMIESLQSLISECKGVDPAHPERISDVYAGYMQATLETSQAIEVEADASWRDHARQQTERINLEPVSAGPFLDQQLRPYQREGVAWLRFLERAGYSGILADDMGLGKTVQALAWLQLERISESARGVPSLVVCPTSLVDNWAREASRFVPHWTTLIVAGSDRHRNWDAIPDHDLVITSYALLRRDIGRYVHQPFAAAVLDEAQHIKNRSTKNAVAAKQLRAVHRLVLTGTPMENSVADLWSIMDFLMPGYLGPHPRFRETVERPIAAGGEQADRALLVLRCKMQPFMLRRLKSTVARDLPEKVTRIATCHLSPEQAELYVRLQDEYQSSVRTLIEQQGFARSRFTVLKTLLRLRQVCCHPALLKVDGIDATTPSAKVDLFFELLNEAMDGNHRVLVFSQFVEMLHILRDELHRRTIPFAYLDGSTQNRQTEIDRFNQNAEIPLFLVSLKAGGTGLNLTGANVVIHYDPWWNPAVEDQATDRAHRIGQTRNVYSIKLVTRGTVEEKVLELQERKRLLFDAAVGGTSDAVQSLSWEDVRHLLSME
jgi:superfamily II DNA or RNA helicase